MIIGNMTKDEYIYGAIMIENYLRPTNNNNYPEG